MLVLQHKQSTISRSASLILKTLFEKFYIQNSWCCMFKHNYSLFVKNSLLSSMHVHAFLPCFDFFLCSCYQIAGCKCRGSVLCGIVMNFGSTIYWFLRLLYLDYSKEKTLFFASCICQFTFLGLSSLDRKETELFVAAPGWSIRHLSLCSLSCN